MTPHEIQAAAKTLAEKIDGPNPWVTISIHNHGAPCGGAGYRDWPMSDPEFSGETDTWEALFDDMERQLAEKSEERRERTIKGMALEIIRLVDEHGHCTDAALRGTRFSAAEVERYGAEACEKADEMAGKGPFEIVALGKANAA